MSKFIQYALWVDCTIGCKFCYNKGQKDIDKIESLKFILNKLDEKEVEDYDEIGFIGGEFFNKELEDSKVLQLFYQLFKKLKEKPWINKIYLTTSLIYDISNYLKPFLIYLNDLKLLQKTLLCTSYDIAYRFYTKQREDLWKTNMLELHREFPQLKTHVETIITQKFIDAVLNDEFSIKKFCNIYHTRMDFIDPDSGFYYANKIECQKDIPGFFPTKKSFIEFLYKEGIKSNEIELNTFLSMNLRSNKAYYLDNGKHYVKDNRREGYGEFVPIDKEKKYERGFIDSDLNMREVVEEFMETVDYE
jgi:hypothetical protein